MGKLIRKSYKGHNILITSEGDTYIDNAPVLIEPKISNDEKLEGVLDFIDNDMKIDFGEEELWKKHLRERIR